MKLKPNKHKRIYFNTTTQLLCFFIVNLPLLPNLTFSLDSPFPQLFWSEMFRSLLKLGGMLACLNAQNLQEKTKVIQTESKTKSTS